MLVKMLCGIKNISFNLPADIEILDFKLTTNPGIFKNEFLTEGFLKTAGQIACNTYLNNPYFHLQTEFLTESDSNLLDEESKAIELSGTAYFKHLEGIIMFLWFIRDNSVRTDNFHSYMPSAKQMIVRNNFDTYSNANGEFSNAISYTIEEIDLAAKIYLKFSSLCYHTNLKEQKSHEPKPDIIRERELIPYNYSETTRIERAIHFLKFARGTSLLPLKISFYMCIYEALFSGITKSEISHQIAERVGIYGGYNKHSRRGIYQLMKGAYDIRSIYFHGQSFKKVKKDLKEISNRIDTLTRDILYKVIMRDSKIFEQESDMLEKSFLELLFSDRKITGLTIESKPEFLIFPA